MYNHGKGEYITRTEYLRWKFRNNTKVMGKWLKLKSEGRIQWAYSILSNIYFLSLKSGKGLWKIWGLKTRMIKYHVIRNWLNWLKNFPSNLQVVKHPSRKSCKLKRPYKVLHKLQYLKQGITYKYINFLTENYMDRSAQNYRFNIFQTCTSKILYSIQYFRSCNILHSRRP